MTRSEINVWDERRGTNSHRVEEIRSEAQHDLSRLITRLLSDDYNPKHRFLVWVKVISTAHD